MCGLKSELSSKLKASLKGNKNEEMKAIHYALEEKMKHHLKELEEIKDVNSILKMKKDSKIHTEVCQYVMKFADY